jgi:uncharacterized protein YwqG
MLPDFLGEFRSQLKTYKLDYVRIEATPLPLGDSVALTRSKFLGKPYLPVGAPYPHDVLVRPMILLAQLNFAEVPSLEGYPTEGIFQLFVSGTEWMNADPKDYRILFHPNPVAEAQTDFSFLTPALYTDSPILAEHTLAFSRATEYGGAADCRFAMDFGGKDYYEYQETLPQAQQQELDHYCYTNGHKMGGYTFFTQGDPRDYGTSRQQDLLLLQIDTDNEIEWGDSGVANIFISPEALRAKQFDAAWFTWDCC